MIPLLLRRPLRSPFRILCLSSVRAASTKTKTSTRSKKEAKDDKPNPIITPGSENHNDLPSFLAYAERVGLTSEKTVYVGTHYEYIVAQSLARLGFGLVRTGRASDFGIDLLGTWTLHIPRNSNEATDPPPPPKPKTKRRSAAKPPPHDQQILRVLIQCKNTNIAPGPKHIRELEGAFTGAPAAWRSAGDFLGLLACTQKATRGVIDALARSRWPMGFLKVNPGDGRVEQFVWNPSARQRGLEGLGVTLRYLPQVGDGADARVRTDVALTWEGRKLAYAHVEGPGALEEELREELSEGKAGTKAAADVAGEDAASTEAAAANTNSDSQADGVAAAAGGATPGEDAPAPADAEAEAENAEPPPPPKKRRGRPPKKREPEADPA
ncbi:uncharacterized protein K452DRAFT_292194 [Aplosporella prunicola CBS 121167]|uniref:Required for respiratory growth protein 7, mitochondrial n=1 Tax=Aplosporella prunicola CBS 121167 TaxID=1176127 RepID=A0A6A6AYI9_9PEZI|nr:uncharacterized protein K452DRAFT_292194 [Aplosporella prunicola CBS 121167]KAF2136676.1 hypothetical protein K452DRAFT_292194 [Aplosporella prunicola CBS 121167]